MFGYLRAVRDMSSLVTQVQNDNVALREDVARERTARYYAQVRMAELKTEHATTIADLKSRLTVAQANFEWLSAMHNQAAAERSELMRQKVGVAVPALSVQVRRDMEQVGSGQPFTDEMPSELSEIAASVAENDLFNDMGDKAASVMGVDKPRTYDSAASLLED